MSLTDFGAGYVFGCIVATVICWFVMTPPRKR